MASQTHATVNDGETSEKFFTKQTVKWLKGYLKDRNVQADDRRKADLVKLAWKASQIGVEKTPKDDNTEQDGVHRRTINKIILPDPSTLHCWNEDLSNISGMNINDVFIYGADTCGWGNGRLKRYKEDNSWQLHKSRHVHSVSTSSVERDGCQYHYVKGKCLPETKQSEAPYSLWILLNSNMDVITGQCDCVA